MERRLILDTCVLIAIERGKLQIGEIVKTQDDVALARVTVTELIVGALLADQKHQEARQAAVSRATSAFAIEEYTDAVSRKHAELMVWTRRAGQPRGALDLIIAATAAATERTLVTTDRAAVFQGMPGVISAEPQDL